MDLEHDAADNRVRTATNGHLPSWKAGWVYALTRVLVSSATPTRRNAAIPTRLGFTDWDWRAIASGREALSPMGQGSERLEPE